MIIPTKEVLIKIVKQQGYPYNSVEGENLYLNLQPLREGDWTALQIQNFLINLREKSFPELDVPEVLRNLEIL